MLDTSCLTLRQLEQLFKTALRDLERRNTLALPPCESCVRPCKARPSAAVMDFCPNWVWREEINRKI